MAKSTSKAFDKSVSPVGWYTAWILMRQNWDGDNESNPNRRCLCWENQILIKAKTPEQAYAKALEHGRQHEAVGEFWEEGNEANKGRWVFEGLTELVAIYDKLEDGAEISWGEIKNKSVKTMQAKVLPKEKLVVFEK